jgi:NADPH2:quinone reductase
LNNKGSLFLTRPSLFHYIADRKSLEKRANDIFDWIISGELKIRINHKYPLQDAVQAHQDLEARKTSGKILLIP